MAVGDQGVRLAGEGEDGFGRGLGVTDDQGRAGFDDSGGVVGGVFEAGRRGGIHRGADGLGLLIAPLWAARAGLGVSPVPGIARGQLADGPNEIQRELAAHVRRVGYWRR